MAVARDAGIEFVNKLKTMAQTMAVEFKTKILYVLCIRHFDISNSLYATTRPQAFSSSHRPTLLLGLVAYYYYTTLGLASDYFTTHSVLYCQQQSRSVDGNMPTYSFVFDNNRKVIIQRSSIHCGRGWVRYIHSSKISKPLTSLFPGISLSFQLWHFVSDLNKKAVLSQGIRAMPL